MTAVQEVQAPPRRREAAEAPFTGYAERDIGMLVRDDLIATEQGLLRVTRRQPDGSLACTIIGGASAEIVVLPDDVAAVWRPSWRR